MNGEALQSGKGHKDENFPVASVLIVPRFRAPVMAFYQFVRFADDVADHATAAPEEKLRLLEEMRATLSGESDASPEGVHLRQVCDERHLTIVHALDLESNQQEGFTVLGAWDSEPEKGIVSYLSPVAQSLLNHKVGDEVEFEIHGVRHHHRIISIEPFKTGVVTSVEQPAQ